jgi:uncharacterized RDD family membrane protein YckC
MSAPASIARRFGAAFYDLLVVAALWMLVYFSLIAAGAVSGTLDDNRDPRHWLLRAAIAFLYFAWCWTRSGRTLGLLSWNLVLLRDDGRVATLPDATARFALACLYLLPIAVLESGFRLAVPPALFYTALVAPFLLGALWALRDPQGRALHERFLATRVVTRVTES